MRPPVLDPLFAPVHVIDGIGPRIAKILGNLLPVPEAMAEPRVLGLVFHLPHSIIDRRKQPGIAFAPEGAIVTLKVRIDRHQPAPRGRGNVPYRVFAHDETGEIGLVFFHAKPAWLEKSLPVGETMLISGRVEWFNGRPSMVHPDHMVPEASAADLPLVEPVYPLTAGVTPKVLRKAILSALTRVPDLPEWIDPHVMTKQDFGGFRDSLERRTTRQPE